MFIYILELALFIFKRIVGFELLMLY